MAVLGRFADLSANEVAERTAMDKVAVSRAVARLLERGLIKREIHSDDRRRSVLALSEVGYSVYDEVAPMALACEQRLIATLDEDERSTLDRLLVKLGGPGLSRTARRRLSHAVVSRGGWRLPACNARAGTAPAGFPCP